MATDPVKRNAAWDALCAVGRATHPTSGLQSACVCACGNYGGPAASDVCRLIDELTPHFDGTCATARMEKELAACMVQFSKVRAEARASERVIARLVKQYSCNCGHSEGCARDAVTAYEDDDGTIWIMCAHCMAYCTGPEPDEDYVADAGTCENDWCLCHR